MQEEGFELELARDMSYDSVAEAVAAKLEVDDPLRLRFTQHNPYSQLPKPHPLKWQGAPTLEDMMTQGFYGQQPSHTLFYEVLDIPLPEFERLKTLKARLLAPPVCPLDTAVPDLFLLCAQHAWLVGGVTDWFTEV